MARNAFTTFAFIFVFLTLCFFGEQITLQVDQLCPMFLCMLLVIKNAKIFYFQYLNCGEVVYMSQWYNLPKKDAIFISLMMGIRRFPKVLTAGKFKLLSLTTFGDVSLQIRCYFKKIFLKCSFINYLNFIGNEKNISYSEYAENHDAN